MQRRRGQEDTLRLAALAGIKTVPTGISHGTVTLIVHGVPFEVTTLRHDIETHGRHATVAFSEDWVEDARRRDFTMNALYADSKGAVYDPLEGAAIWPAVSGSWAMPQGVQEDYLRILRFFRFSAQYSRGAFDREGVAASIRERFGLRRLSRERIRSELFRILVARRAVDAIEVMDESGLLILIFCGVMRRERFNRLCQIEAALGLRPDPIFQLAALTVFIQEDVARLSAKLRLSSQETNTLLSLASAPSIIQPRARDLKAALYRLGPRIYLGCVLLAWASADASVNNADWTSAVDLLRSWPRPQVPIGGADLIARGWGVSGAALGDRLRRLEEEWIESGFLLSREDLLQLPDNSL